jgi:hypothetical protein
MPIVPADYAAAGGSGSGYASGYGAGAGTDAGTGDSTSTSYGEGYSGFGIALHGSYGNDVIDSGGGARFEGDWNQTTFGGGNFDFNSVGGGMSNGVGFSSLGNLAGLEMYLKLPTFP